MNNLSQPAIPRISIMGDPMPTEWQNFFRDLFVRVGGSRSYTLSEINEVVGPMLSLSPSMLVATGEDGKVTSASDLTQWISGVTGQVAITGDEPGKIVISVPGVVPIGGSTGQPLIKKSNDDYDLAWGDVSVVEVLENFGNIDFYLDLLTGQITEDELFGGLKSRLNMIDVDFIYDQVYNEVFSGMNGDFDGFYRQAQAVRGDLTAESNARLALNAVVISNGNSIIAHSAILQELNNTISDPETGLVALSNAWSLLDSRVEVNEGNITSQASAISALQTTVDNPTTGLSAVAGAVSVLDARVTVIDGTVTSQSSSIITLTGHINTLYSTTNSHTTAISGIQTTITNLDGEITATADSVIELESTVGENSAAIVVNAQTTATLTNNVKAEYSLWLNANGKITGFRSMIDHTGSNEFDIVSDRFRIINVNNNGDIKVPFIVGNISGVPTVGINGNLVIDGTILARHISVSTLSAITANVGTLNAGIVQSDDYDSTHGFKIDLTNSLITVNKADGLIVNSTGGIKLNSGGDLSLVGSSTDPAKLILKPGTGSYSTAFYTSYAGSASFIAPSNDNQVSLSFGHEPGSPIVDDSLRFINITFHTYSGGILFNHYYSGDKGMYWKDNALWPIAASDLGKSTYRWASLFLSGGISIQSYASMLTASSGVSKIWAYGSGTDSDMFVIGGTGSANQISPHNFSLFTPDPDYLSPWSYYSYNDFLGRRINVDMYGAIVEIEKLSGKKLIYIEDYDHVDWETYHQAQIDKRQQEIYNWNALSSKDKEKVKKPEPMEMPIMPEYMKVILNKKKLKDEPNGK